MADKAEKSGRSEFSQKWMDTKHIVMMPPNKIRGISTALGNSLDASFDGAPVPVDGDILAIIKANPNLTREQIAALMFPA